MINIPAMDRLLPNMLQNFPDRVCGFWAFDRQSPPRNYTKVAEKPWDFSMCPSSLRHLLCSFQGVTAPSVQNTSLGRKYCSMFGGDPTLAGMLSVTPPVFFQVLSLFYSILACGFALLCCSGLVQLNSSSGSVNAFHHCCCNNKN